MFTPVINVAVYELDSQEPSPVSLAAMKAYLKVTVTTDDALIQGMIDSSTEWGEKYTSRDFRVRTWNLLLDFFRLTGPVTTFDAGEIGLRRDPVESIVSVKHLVDDSLVTVDSSIYYLKKLPQFSEILLFQDKSWPTDTDPREQAIEVQFKTKGYRCQNSIIEAIERMVAYWYRNRGDCADCTDAAKQSGVTAIYDQFRIVRV